MLKIHVGNSYSRIEGLDSKTHAHLKKLLSYEVDPQAAYYMGGHRPRVKYLIDAKGSFPTGLLRRVERFLVQVGLSFAVNRPNAPIDRVGLEPDFGSIVPYPDQQAAVTVAVSARGGILSLPTGSGKSLVIALLIERLDVRTLVVVPNLELKRQLSESLEEIFGRTPHIRVENIDSKALQSLKDFDALVIDECHHAAASTYQKLNKTAWAGISRRYCLTATPFRNQENEQLLFEGICGEVLYRLTYADAVKRGYIVPVEAYFVESPKKETDAYTWAQVYKELVVNNEERNAIIADLLLTLKEADKSALCLVKEIAHGEILSTLTGIPFANGKDEDSREFIKDFSSNRLRALIATTGVVGEGVDTKPCEYVIIAGLGKAKSAFQQQVGRAVRRFGDKESAKVLIIADKSHKFTLRHFREQAKILLQEYGAKPVLLE